MGSALAVEGLGTTVQALTQLVTTVAQVDSAEAAAVVVQMAVCQEAGGTELFFYFTKEVS